MERIKRCCLIIVIAAVLITFLAFYVWAINSRDHGPHSVHATFLREEDGVAAVKIEEGPLRLFPEVTFETDGMEALPRPPQEGDRLFVDYYTVYVAWPLRVDATEWCYRSGDRQIDPVVDLIGGEYH